MKQIKTLPHIGLGVVAVVLTTMALMFATIPASAQVAQINGEDVAQPADTVINPPSYGSDLKGKLLDSGISFIHVVAQSDQTTTVTLFESEDIERVCGWETELTKGIRLVFNGDDVTCSE